MKQCLREKKMGENRVKGTERRYREGKKRRGTKRQEDEERWILKWTGNKGKKRLKR